MPSTYAAYYNIVSSQPKTTSRKPSTISNTSSTSTTSTASQDNTPDKTRSKKPSLATRILTQLKPTDEPAHPTGPYSSLIKQGPLFSRKRQHGEPKVVVVAEEGESRRASQRAGTPRHSVMQAAVEGAIMRH